MNKGSRYTLLAVVGVVVLAFMSPSPALSADSIKVGIVLPLTGAQAKFGEIEKQSLRYPCC